MKSDREKIWNTLWPVLRKKYKRTGTFLNYKNPFELLIAVILSAQTTDEGVNKVTEQLFKIYPTVDDLAHAPINKLRTIIRSVGYFNTKSRYIKKTAEMILKKYKGIVPLEESALKTFPGVGRKTIVVVLSHLLDENFGIPVDTHVIRFAHRFDLSSSKNPDIIEQDLCKIIPKKYWKQAAYAIKEYGRHEGRARGYQKELDPLWIRLHVKK